MKRVQPSRRVVLRAAAAVGLGWGVRGAVGQGTARNARVAWIGGAAGALPTPVYLQA